MGPIAHLWHSDNLRKTRFHTGAGTLCLNPVQLTKALASTALRHLTGQLVNLPWLPYPAIEWLRTLPRNLSVFEYGGGMSTAWYARRFRDVHSVEGDLAGFARIHAATAAQDYVTLTLEQDRNRYISSIERTERRSFDLVVMLATIGVGREELAAAF